MTLPALIRALRDDRRLRLAMERDRRILTQMEDRRLDDIGLDREELDALLAGGLWVAPRRPLQSRTVREASTLFSFGLAGAGSGLGDGAGTGSDRPR